MCALAIFHHPANVIGKVELLTVRANRPALVTIQDDATLGIGDDVFQAAIRSGVNIDVGHALNGHAIEGTGAVGAAGAFKDNFSGSGIGFFNHLSTSNRTHQNALINEHIVLSWHAIIVKTKTTRGVRLKRVGSSGKLF